MKKPEFKLFRICDKETSKALQGWHNLNTPYFTQLGCFYRSPETIRKHLKNLIHKNKGYGRFMHSEFIHSEPIEGAISRYYVEVYSVIALDKHTHEAAEYLGIKKDKANG